MDESLDGNEYNTPLLLVASLVAFAFVFLLVLVLSSPFAPSFLSLSPPSASAVIVPFLACSPDTLSTVMMTSRSLVSLIVVEVIVDDSPQAWCRLDSMVSIASGNCPFWD
jgi:hypothetical protein